MSRTPVVLRPVWRVLPCLALAALGWLGPSASGEVPIVEVRVRRVEQHGSRLAVDVPAPRWGSSQSRLIVVQAGQPLGWFEPVAVGREGGAFVSRRGLDLPAETEGLRAWVIGPDIVAALRPRWPVDAEFRAKIEGVGLGADSVWIDAGCNQGVVIGDCWWRRVNGQPVARYDVRLVDSAVCFCRVQALAAGLGPARGDIVSLWPGPRQRRIGRAATAVSFVEPASDGQTVWVAAPPRVAAPVEARLDFYRAGNYVGSGVVERRDRRFWYARTLSAAGLGDVRVGDDAVVRTSADLHHRRFSARVFELTPAGCLINAGEIDGLSAGDVGTVYRAGREIGRVKLLKVQRGYSVARLEPGDEHVATTQPTSSSVPAPGRGSDGLQRLDEVCFGPRQRPLLTLGAITRVVEGTLFSAQVTGAAPLLTPLAVRHAGRVIGVAVLLDVTDRRALGFVLACSLTEFPAAGDELALAPDLVSRGEQPARFAETGWHWRARRRHDWRAKESGPTGESRRGFANTRAPLRCAVPDSHGPTSGGAGVSGPPVPEAPACSVRG